MSKQQVQRTSCLRKSTKWARYEVSGYASIQSECVRRHAQTDIHKAALKAHLEPQLPLTTLLPDDSADSDLLRGHVPQLGHWLRVWRYIRTPTSCRAAECLQSTESYIAQSRLTDEQSSIATRKAVASMVMIQAEVVRQAKRDIIAASSSITISLDDRGAYRLIRFRCCTLNVNVEADDDGGGVGVSAPDGTGVARVSAARLTDDLHASMRVPGLESVYSGVLGVVKCADPTAKLQELDEDYSQRMANSVVNAVRKACTPLKSEMDQALFRHFCRHVHTYLADGGSSVQKAGMLLQEHFTRLRLVVRDTAHMLRSSCSEPIKQVAVFDDFWNDIFNSRHALVPDIQNSDAWRAKLLMAQNHVLSTKGKQGGGLKVALKHLSFAKQRFDSAACPARKFCCMLSAIVVTLAVTAEDSRLKWDVRKRASDHINNFTVERILAAGLFADYSAEVLKLVRLADSSEHDVAKLSGDVEEFLRRMRRLFIEGYIMADIDMPGDAVLATCTVIAARQAMEFGSLCVGQRVVELWPGSSAKECARRVLARISEVVEALSERLRVELGTGNLLVHFKCFNFGEWVAAGDDEVRRSRLRQSFRKLFAATCDHRAEESAAAMRHARRFEQVARSNARLDTDNRRAWEQIVKSVPLERALVEVVQWYLSVSDTTGPVERGLGRLVAVLDAHGGKIIGDDTGALLEAHLDGHAEESKVARLCDGVPGVVDPALGFTTYSRRCAELWLLLHGRRFAAYTHRRGHKQACRGPKSDISVMRGQKRSLDVLSTTTTPAREVSTIDGSNVESLRVGAANVSRDPERLKQYRKQTRDKLKLQSEQNKRRATKQKPYAPGPARKGNLFDTPNAAVNLNVGCKRVLNASSHADLRALRGHRMLATPSRGDSTAQLWSLARNADVMVVDSVGLSEGAPRAHLVAMCSAIVWGKQVATVAQYNDNMSRARLYKKALDQKAGVGVSTSFAERHAGWTALLRRCAQESDGRWHFDIKDDAAQGVVISNMGTMLAFFRREQRVQNSGFMWSDAR